MTSTMQSLENLHDQLIQAIRRVVPEIFETMAYQEVLPTSQTVAEGIPTPECFVGTIVMNRTGGVGKVRIYIPPVQAQGVVACLLGQTPDQVTEESSIVDGIGELLNMIGGGAKAMLSGESHTSYKLSLPKVFRVSGEGLCDEPLSHSHLSTRMVFALEGHPFWIDIAYEGEEG